jgi:hypothetical protein
VVDPRRPQAEADDAVFGFLGVRIRHGAVWTTGPETASRRLGPLAGARAGLDEPRRSRIGAFISSVLLAGAPPKGAKLFVTFADGSRYERMPVPWLSDLDWPKVSGEIGRFNTAAHLASKG